MKWLEIIELRSVDKNKKFLEQALKVLMEDLNQEVEQLAIKVFCRVNVDSDFSIHLLHDSKEADVNGSALGLQLVSYLKEYGLINHSVWVEKHSS
jgi:hypothetical protein